MVIPYEQDRHTGNEVPLCNLHLSSKGSDGILDGAIWRLNVGLHHPFTSHVIVHNGPVFQPSMLYLWHFQTHFLKHSGGVSQTSYGSVLCKSSSWITACPCSLYCWCTFCLIHQFVHLAIQCHHVHPWDYTYTTHMHPITPFKLF